MEPCLRVRRIGIASAMKTAAGVGAGVGFIIGSVWGVVMVFFSAALSALSGQPLGGFGVIVVFIAPIAGAVVYSVILTLVSFVVTVMYNLIAGITGGIELDLELHRNSREPDQS